MCVSLSVFDFFCLILLVFSSLSYCPAHSLCSHSSLFPGRSINKHTLCHAMHYTLSWGIFGLMVCFGDTYTKSNRHEFLGPDPRVAGYTFDYDGEVHIKWWDGFLKDQWIENQKWTFEFVRDANGDLVEKDG